MIATLLKWVVPWEFSWLFLATFVLACVLYWRGSRRLQVPLSRRLAFWIGMAIIYLSLHTYLDYYAEHEFFMHRLQQLLLHHLAPLLIVIAYPASALRAVAQSKASTAARARTTAAGRFGGGRSINSRTRFRRSTAEAPVWALA